MLSVGSPADYSVIIRVQNGSERMLWSVWQGTTNQHWLLSRDCAVQKCSAIDVVAGFPQALKPSSRSKHLCTLEGRFIASRVGSPNLGKDGMLKHQV
jgi:hypothetical protein